MKTARHILTLSAALASLCGIALAALWIWTKSAPSYHYLESTPSLVNLSFTANSHLFGLQYYSTEIIIEPPIDPPDMLKPRPYGHHFLIEIGYPDTHLGFSIGSVRRLTSIRYELTSNQSRYVTMHFFLTPYWVCIPMLAWFPLLLLRRRSRRVYEGLCPKCHYDLRAHHPGDKCPECGTVISPASPP